jgi:thiol-disulfide isomerase/thioredoxin
VVASTLDARDEFGTQKVNEQSYTNKHMNQIFGDGFSFSGFEKDKIWLKLDDQYLDVSDVSGADDDGDGRALCVADFDDDGDPEFFVHNIQRERHMLYRNDIDRGAHGVKVQLKATKGPWQAPGAIVRVSAGGRTTAQLMTIGTGFVSQNASELIFGLGDAAEGTVTVRWPGRAVESFGAVKAGGKVLLVEGAGKPAALPRKPYRLRDPGVPGLKFAEGANVASLELSDAAGKTVPLKTAGRKKPLIVNLWATYCASCVGEMGDLAKLAAAGHDVVLVSLDAKEDFARAQELLKGMGIKLPNWFAAGTAFEKLLDPERLPLPTTLFFAPDGTMTEALQTTIDHWNGWSKATGGQ